VLEDESTVFGYQPRLRKINKKSLLPIFHRFQSFILIRHCSRLALKLIMTRFFSPHLMLVGSCALYVIIGALMFQRLEGERLKEVKREQTENIARSGQLYIDRIWELTQQEKDKYESTEDLVAVVKTISKEEFHDYVDTVFTAHRASRHGYD
ncbi:hypothetical protein NECAME_08330, partial [Necator americanus]